MSQAGDKHERGASVSRITDASGRRKRHRAAPAPPPGAPDAGTGLLSSMDLEPEGELGTAAPADDVLDQVLTPGIEPSARQSGIVLDAGPRPPAGFELDDVQQQIDHLHERAQHTQTRSAARGSADLAPALPQGSPRRHSQTESSTEATRAGGLRTKRILLIVAVCVVIGLFGVTVGSLGSDEAATKPALARGQHSIAVDASATIEHVLSAVTASIAAPLREAESAAALAAKKAKARAEVRARARAAIRARDIAARRRRRAPTQTTATAPPAPTAAASSTGSEPTYSTSPPQTSYRAPSSDTGSASAGSSGSTSLPVGPTGIGSAGRNCNPKCS